MIDLNVDIFAIVVLLIVLGGLFFINYRLDFGQPKTKGPLLDVQDNKQVFSKASLLVMLVWVAMGLITIWIAALMMGITPQM